MKRVDDVARAVLHKAHRKWIERMKRGRSVKAFDGPGLIPANPSGACFQAAQRLSEREPDTASPRSQRAGHVEERPLSRTSIRAAVEVRSPPKVGGK